MIIVQTETGKALVISTDGKGLTYIPNDDPETAPITMTINGQSDEAVLDLLAAFDVILDLHLTAHKLPTEITPEMIEAAATPDTRPIVA